MHFSLIACTSSFISLSLHRCALGLLQTYIVEIPSCQNHGSKSQGFCVSHSLVHDIKWKGGEGGGEDIVSLSPKLHLLILDLCGSGDWCCLCCFSCVWSHPRLVLSWMFSLRLSLKITSLLTPPPHKRGSLSWIGHCLRREQGGLLKPAGSLSVLLSW